MLINVPAVRNIHHPVESQRATHVMLSLHSCSSAAAAVCCHKFKFILLKEEKLGSIFYRHAYLSSYITLQILFILLMLIEKCEAFYSWSILGSSFVPSDLISMLLMLKGEKMILREGLGGWYFSKLSSQVDVKD